MFYEGLRLREARFVLFYEGLRLWGGSGSNHAVRPGWSATKKNSRAWGRRGGGGGEIPYQDWALEKKQENWAGRPTADPETKCYLPGVPRATYLPYPFQILQGTDKIMIVYGFAEANRTIHMNVENPEAPPLDTWMGRSYGNWEGNTLVVEAQGFLGEAWFDRAGNFASSALRVTERYTPISPDALLYEATIEDPTVFTRPWQIRMPLYRRLEPNARVVEYKCVEFSEEILYGHLMKKEE